MASVTPAVLMPPDVMWTALELFVQQCMRPGAVIASYQAVPPGVLALLPGTWGWGRICPIETKVGRADPRPCNPFSPIHITIHMDGSRIVKWGPATYPSCGPRAPPTVRRL